MAEAPPVVDDYRELLIVHPAAVDPFLNGGRSHNGGPTTEPGPLSLRFLLQMLANPLTEASRQKFYASFFEQWLTDQTADNGIVIPGRDPVAVKRLLLDRFSRIDAATGERVFELWKLPFELIAVVNRLDLRSADGSDAGEVRLVYKLVGPQGEDLKFTLNMEYAQRTKYFSAETWAHNWHRLGTMAVGSEEYLSALERLVWWSVASIIGEQPVLRHARTNELAFDDGPGGVWQMREFEPVRLPNRALRMVASSVENTPRTFFNGTPELAAFIAANPILGAPGTAFMDFKLPETLTTASGPVTFLDGRSSAGVKWTVPGEVPQSPSVAVDNLGLLTCNGCHQDNKSALPGEIEFYQIKPDVGPGLDGSSRLSKFLTTSDPAKADRRPGELNRRRARFQALLSQPWTPQWID